MDRYITVAIHTYDHAHALKSLLEKEGIEVTLQNVNLDHPIVSAGIRVRIHESDLPLALRVIENPEIFGHQSSSEFGEPRGELLVPIDFSPCSQRAVDLAFHTAREHKLGIFLLHSYIDPFIVDNIQLSDTLSFDNEIEASEELMTVEHNAENMMAQCAEKLRERMRKGELPPVKFSYEVAEGLPEEVVDEYAKERNPWLIIMGTRGADTKERELVGSVTAEVLDSCRYPIFTVPESAAIKSPKEIERVVFFCNLDQEDMLALDALNRMLPNKGMKIVLANIPSRRHPVTEARKSLDVILDYCKDHYPDYEFEMTTLKSETLTEDFAHLEKSGHIDLLCVPNKKKNIFARFFNPGIAHKILFHADIPMMVIPV